MDTYIFLDEASGLFTRRIFDLAWPEADGMFDWVIVVKHGLKEKFINVPFVLVRFNHNIFLVVYRCQTSETVNIAVPASRIIATHLENTLLLCASFEVFSSENTNFLAGQIG